jgi:hypothetical protein
MKRMTCPYCNPNTAGLHEYNCPLNEQGHDINIARSYKKVGKKKKKKR